MTVYGYPNIYAIGHKAIEGIFNEPVLVEEKIDGSQFSFGLLDGTLQCRSKGVQQNIDAPDKMFEPAISYVKHLAASGLLKEGWIYRTEFLSKPKHNALEYSRIPRNGLILFDVNPALESYIDYDGKRSIASEFGIEVVPLVHSGMISDFSQLAGFLNRESCLGGPKIEGIVVKNYSRFTTDKKVMMGKYVSESFKEVLEMEWGRANPSSGDILQTIISAYKTPARWNKSVQHLRDAGTLSHEPKDIGSLIKEVRADVIKEEEDAIKQRLFEYFWPKIERGITAGLPEWYKQELAKSAFQ